ncbi:enoyl-CoA hydratase-related protein [Rhodococcus sp. NPDC059968]|uniref:enoyl-CoA hydratase-related protein n=1 Tax=Rhodococcus sp. NPDC059968 TaxID=3347017 RepID=UPI00366CBA9B
MATENTVLTEKRDSVFYITLNRPDALNAHNVAMEVALMDALRSFQADNELLVAVLTGAGGRAFSTGMDLKEVARYEEEGLGQRPYELLRFAEIGVWKPIIGAIDGHCLAGGFELALQCDIRIATRPSTFGLPEPRWNYMANYYGCHHLSRMIPLGEALYMQLTGNRIDADVALRSGLVHSIHADRASLLEEADAIAEAITMCSPLAIKAIKEVAMNGRSLPIGESYRMGEPLMWALGDLEDAVEGPKAYAEKRRPVWKMR